MLIIGYNQLIMHSSLQKRSLLKVVIFSIFTVGIYDIYWIYKTRQEIVGGLNDPKAIPLFRILALPFVALLIALIVSFVQSYNQSEAGANALLNGLMILVGLVGVIGFFTIPLWWFFKYFQATNKLTKRTEPILLYVIWLICIFIAILPVWILIVQNDLNKTVDALANQTPGSRPQNEPPYPTHFGTPPAAGTYNS